MQSGPLNNLTLQFLARTEADLNRALDEGLDPKREYLDALRQVWTKEQRSQASSCTAQMAPRSRRTLGKKDDSRPRRYRCRRFDSPPPSTSSTYMTV